MNINYEYSKNIVILSKLNALLRTQCKRLVVDLRQLQLEFHHYTLGSEATNLLWSKQGKEMGY